MAREVHAANQQCPGKAGARVWVWHNIDDFRIRKPAGRQNQTWHWGLYLEAQWQYDSFCNEWDLCTEFDTNEKCIAYNSGGDNDSEYDCTPEFEEGGQLPTDLVDEAFGDNSHLTEEYSSKRDLQVEIQELIKDVRPEIPPTTENLENVAYFKFGFVNELRVAPPCEILEWSLVRKALGDGRWDTHDNTASGELQRSLSSFFGYFKNSTSPMSSL